MAGSVDAEVWVKTALSGGLALWNTRVERRGVAKFFQGYFWTNRWHSLK